MSEKLELYVYTTKTWKEKGLLKVGHCLKKSPKTGRLVFYSKMFHELSHWTGHKSRGLKDQWAERKAQNITPLRN